MVELAGVVCVTEVVVVVVGLGVVAVEVGAAPVVVDWVVDEDVLCLWVEVVVDELWLDPPQAESAEREHHDGRGHPGHARKES